MKWKSLLQNAIGRVITLVQTPVTRLLINVLVFGFCIFYLVENFQEIVSATQQSSINFWFLLAAWLITWIVNWLGGVSWWLLLSGMNQKIDWLEGWQAHFKPALAKYIPGFIWQYVGKGVLTGALGVPARVIGVLLLWEFFQSIWLGLGVGLLFFPQAEILGWELSPGTQIALRGIGIGMLLTLLAVILSAPQLLSRTTGSGFGISKKYFYLSMVIVTFGWIMLGLSLWMTLASFQRIEFNSYPFAIFSLTMSLVGGILVLPVPNGLGVREGIMIYLLSPVITKQVALLVSVVSRLQLISGEIFCVILFEIIRHVRSKRRSKRPEEVNTSNGLL